MKVLLRIWRDEREKKEKGFVCIIHVAIYGISAHIHMTYNFFFLVWCAWVGYENCECFCYLESNVAVITTFRFNLPKQQIKTTKNWMKNQQTFILPLLLLCWRKIKWKETKDTNTLNISEQEEAIRLNELKL